jgi:hypothetical protein
MLRGTGAIRAGVMGLVATLGAGEASAGWDAGPTGAAAGSGVVARSGRITAFGFGIMSAPAGTLAAGATGAVLRWTCPSTMLRSCCWCMTKVLNTPTIATAITRTANQNLFERTHWKFI